MMLTRRSLLPHLSVVAATAVMGLLGAPARAAETINVVASFSILGDLARQIGGDRVTVTTLVKPNSDAHGFQPTPADARTLGSAKVLVTNGLGFEGWIARLQKASGFKGLVAIASKGVKPRQMEEEEGGRKRKVTDPHAWQSLQNGKFYVANIRDGLIRADPSGKAAYEANATKLLADIDQLDAEVKAAIAKLPPERRKIITTHDAFGYFGTTYGFEFIAPEGVSTESEPSAQDIARIIRQIKAEKIPAVFLENVTDRRLLDQIASESGAVVGGTLYSDSLSDPSGPAPTYLDMFRSNIRTLTGALSAR
jgi:zinc/manganese transport system substrate-binding protein